MAAPLALNVAGVDDGATRAFYVGLSALGFGSTFTQGVALGWDVAAPLALSVAG